MFLFLFFSFNDQVSLSLNDLKMKHMWSLQSSRYNWLLTHIFNEEIHSEQSERKQNFLSTKILSKRFRWVGFFEWKFEKFYSIQKNKHEPKLLIHPTFRIFSYFKNLKKPLDIRLSSFVFFLLIIFVSISFLK